MPNQDSNQGNRKRVVNIMSANGSRKLYSAELKMLKEQGKAVPGQTGLAAPITNGVGNREVLEAINALADRLGAPLDSEPLETADVPELNAEFERDLEMAHNLRSELRAMSRSIKETKAEIKSMRIGGRGNDPLLTATSELDAVVTATEEATNSILEATETIEGLAQKIELNADTDDDRRATEDIMEQTIKVLEACNFQDVTGQRITKVVNTLKFVEERIDAMIEIWGEADISEVDPSVAPDENSDAALLNGPALDGEGIDQDDIDKLFD
tara:strand:+ start:834 stop:1643 length:810 start_codon:yes stop_codon:yes gene_type:complete